MMARNFVIKDDYGHHVRMKAGSTAISEGDMVTLSGGALVAVADANTVGAVGVAAEDIAANEYGTVYTAGVFTGSAASGVDFGLGDKVYTASANTLDAGSTGDVAVGKVVYADPASGGTVYFSLWSILEEDVTAHA